MSPSMRPSSVPGTGARTASLSAVEVSAAGASSSVAPTKRTPIKAMPRTAKHAAIPIFARLLGCAIRFLLVFSRVFPDGFAADRERWSICPIVFTWDRTFHDLVAIDAHYCCPTESPRSIPPSQRSFSPSRSTAEDNIDPGLPVRLFLRAIERWNTHPAGRRFNGVIGAGEIGSTWRTFTPTFTITCRQFQAGCRWVSERVWCMR